MIFSFSKVGDNSAGPDMWRPRELRWFGPVTCGWVAEMYNLAEEGEGWPDDLERQMAS